jgi:hypothetical protein
MTSPLNGKTKVAMIAALGGLAFAALTYAGGVYTGWRQNVDDSVTQRRMVNEHDETLKTLRPEVVECHEVNAVQQRDIDRNRQDIASLTEAVKRTNDLLQLYLQSMMKRGEIPR